MKILTNRWNGRVASRIFWNSGELMCTDALTSRRTHAAPIFGRSTRHLRAKRCATMKILQMCLRGNSKAQMELSRHQKLHREPLQFENCSPGATKLQVELQTQNLAPKRTTSSR